MQKGKLYIQDIISEILDMVLKHITQTGNISIPAKWRKELGIDSNSEVLMHREKEFIIIRPLRKQSDAFKAIDQEVANKKIRFTREESVKDDLYH